MAHSVTEKPGLLKPMPMVGNNYEVVYPSIYNTQFQMIKVGTSFLFSINGHAIYDYWT
jgi:hypothetical protein